MIIACTTTVSYSYLLSGKILHISILSNKILYKEKFLWLQLYNKQTNIGAELAGAAGAPPLLGPPRNL